MGVADYMTNLGTLTQVIFLLSTVPSCIISENAKP